MSEFRPEKLKKELAERLVAAGMSEEEAREAATKEVESMGVYKIATGNCPLGGLSPLACQFCQVGHMTECHHPLTCEEAQCGHYQAEIAQEEVL